MSYDYSQHIAWDILTLACKPIFDAALIKKHLRESKAEDRDIELSIKIVDLLNKYWMEEE